MLYRELFFGDFDLVECLTSMDCCSLWQDAEERVYLIQQLDKRNGQVTSYYFFYNFGLKSIMNVECFSFSSLLMVWNL